MATFTYSPGLDARRSIKPRVLSAKFGDGYEQRVGDGINTVQAVWSLSFPGKTRAEAGAIESFFIARAGAEAFDWTDPDGASGKYICREWSRDELGGGRLTIAATFEQVPA